ncbi:MAG: Gfo/Idh/MocA family oxidoreductase [Propionibacteriaceae bacterium]|nr:Gfo/Idh/MocA family oxidoreductase [Propionibacteriaceae bacterium]
MRFGIVGTGFISDWFVEACRAAGGRPLAICSRDGWNGQEFAHKHHLERAVTTVAELAALPEVDAIYVASPIAAHHEQALTALRAGKHVLCEKTLTTNLADTQELFAAAGAAGRLLLEEVRPNFDPAYGPIREAVGRLGELHYAHFEKCQYSSRYPAFLRGEVPNALNPASGSSALRDIGCYCLHPALLLFGKPVSASARNYRLSNGFEAGGAIRLDYGGFTANCVYSKVTQTVTPSFIEGEEGTLTIDSIAEPADVQIIHVDGHVEPVLTGSPRAPKDNLPDAVAAFQRLAETPEAAEPLRRQSELAEQIMGAALEADGGLFHL